MQDQQKPEGDCEVMQRIFDYMVTQPKDWIPAQ